MRTVFLDTVGLVAIWYEQDQWHEKATTAFEAVVKENVRLVTTQYVLAECSNALARTRVRPLVCQLREDLEKAGDLIMPTGDEIQRAWEFYRATSPGEAGVVDLISFEIMRRVGATEAFTNDRHFRTAGFVTLF